MQHRTHLALLALALASVPFALAARPAAGPPQEAGRPDLPEWPGSRARERADERIEALQGCWQLKSIQAAELEAGRHQEVGYLLVSGSFLSIEIHGGWRAAGLTPSREGRGVAVTGSVSTGIHRFEVDEWGTLTTKTLIGTRNGLNMQVEFERPDTERRFELEVDEDKLTMKRDDGAVLRFERLLDGSAKVDFYGRPIKARAKEGAAGGEEPR